MANDKIHIGIDVDGVLRDFGYQFANYVNLFYGKQLSREDFQEYGFPNVTHQGKKIIVDVFTKEHAANYVFGNAPMITNSITGYKKFIKDSAFEVYIVSTQKKEHEEITLRWLKENGFTDHYATFFERNKLKAPVQVLIDDKPDHVKKFLENHRDGVLMDAPYNREEAEQFPLVVEDMIDAYNKVSKYYERYIQR